MLSMQAAGYGDMVNNHALRFTVRELHGFLSFTFCGLLTFKLGYRCSFLGGHRQDGDDVQATSGGGRPGFR